VVEDHVEHDPQVLLVRLAHELVKVRHGAKRWVNLAIVCHIVAVVVLWGDEERRDPDVVDT